MILVERWTGGKTGYGLGGRSGGFATVWGGVWDGDGEVWEGWLGGVLLFSCVL